MPNVLYFASDDNLNCVQVMRKRFSASTFTAVAATPDPATLLAALNKAKPVDLLLIGTHGAHAAFLTISGHEESNAPGCDISYETGHARHTHPATFGATIKPYLAAGAVISLISCSVAGGEHGKTFVMAMSATTDATVRAADNEVQVNTVGDETVNVTVNGGGVWESTKGSYPVEVTKRGSRYQYW
ncbi:MULTISPECIES: DUF4347 domain-containing protein [unclassified Pseudomonas]|uniref:DUF4347 domain-containing protein n=1 Tax=unclassified Pseudomonas TaxID=196821 RepID=UPI0012FDBCC0|nr:MULTISPECIES: DUF4347 domain-containing protein [unclassified Pseudomonas]MCU1738486.1 DUF4347 domain-containing protein [Pseudomonas sp. 20S_6.2_Bac1]